VSTRKSLLSKWRTLTDLTFADLIRLQQRQGGRLVIACDTESHGGHTLTVQFVVRVGRRIIVQTYSSPAIVPQPDADKLLPHLRKLRKRCRNIIIRPARPLTTNLSPARVVADLFGLSGVEPMPRLCADEEQEPDGELVLLLVGHHWPADFFRVFGRDFFRSLVEYQLIGCTYFRGKLVRGKRVGAGLVNTKLEIVGHKLLSFKEGRSTSPILEYAGVGQCLYAIRVGYFDTNRPFGTAKLGDLAKMFVGVPKLDVSDEDKADMSATFAREPVRTWAYAIIDVILTLLVYEGMDASNTEAYRALGFEKGDIPKLRSSLGSRDSEMIVRCLARDAAGSAELARKGKPDEIARTKIKDLLVRGSSTYTAEMSAFKEQTGQTHGGLLFSRSPLDFFIQALGRFRDVDLSGCYANIMRRMYLYAGRPVIFEPGKGKRRRRWTLKKAVAFLLRHAAGRDAWIIKVSGLIAAGLNVLIPSTKDPWTNANYRSRAARRRAKAAAARYGSVFDWNEVKPKDASNTELLTDEVGAGVVAWPTWLMIRALPAKWRRQYENLEVDSIIFYPRKLVANSGAEYDALVRKLSHDGTPWTSDLDMRRLVLTTKHKLDHDYVSLRFDLGNLVRTMQDERKRAIKEHGKDSAQALSWKVQVNSLYGVMASPHLATNNVVAANYITATARALAFAMQLSLNGVQVITDGCTYCRIQVPAGTFADCLAACPDYPINRADFAGPFLDPDTVPEEDAAFTVWFREHVKRFFGVSGPDYDWLFGLHDLQHKELWDGGPTTFDALCCDGACNYVKLQADGAGGWTAAVFKARSYGTDAKAELAGWLIPTYRDDRYTVPSPIVESKNLLTYKEAGQSARTALHEVRLRLRRGEQPTPERVLVPLGLDNPKIQVYKIIKPSAFLFRTARQRRAWERAMGKFGDATCCGLELLVTVRASAGRRKGSLTDVAAWAYRLIRAGDMNPSRALHLGGLTKGCNRSKSRHRREVEARKKAARAAFHRQLIDAGADAETDQTAATLTGLFLGLGDIQKLDSTVPAPKSTL
jgi:hypothetical protein